VQDVGGKIRGQHIDVYFNSHAAAEQFGRQKIEIYIVKG
jgi:3D (Asp-Asp-Asp) domain-containing protein